MRDSRRSATSMNIHQTAFGIEQSGFETFTWKDLIWHVPLSIIDSVRQDEIRLTWSKAPVCCWDIRYLFTWSMQEDDDFAGLDLSRLHVELGPHNQATLAQADLLVMSPGVNPAQPEITAALESVCANFPFRSLLYWWELTLLHALEDTICWWHHRLPSALKHVQGMVC
jgi:hypothetical protein